MRYLYTIFKIKLLLVMTFNCSIAISNNFSKELQQHIVECGINYYQQTTPQILNSQLTINIYPLCFHGFAVMYSGESKTALWSAEYLTKQRLEQASTLERINHFHEESRLLTQHKALLIDYKKTAYDRGHLAPNADMATFEQQYDSFSLVNIVPQNPQHNRQVWRDLEAKVRFLTMKYGESYVITGVVFQGKNIKKLNNNIMIPTHLYKAIYIPSLQQAGVYYTPNDDSQRIEVISLTELEKRINIQLMPALPAFVKNQTLPLPTQKIPEFTVKQSNNQLKHEQSAMLVLINLLNEIIKWLLTVLQN